MMLYFDETEADLWLALQRIEPEKRSAFIKETLRQVLLSTPILGDQLKGTLKEDSKHFAEGIHDDSLEKKLEEMETFSLEALFSEVHVPESEVPDPNVKSVGWVDQEEAKSTAQKRPWDYLIHSVIGEEDDEAVIAALQHSSPSEVQEEQSENLLMKINHPEQKEFDIASLHVDKPVPSIGYEYMMKHIIGIEEDESVLKLLRGTP